MKFKDLKYDKRLLERNITKGVLTRDEVNERIEGLPNLKKKRDKVDLQVLLRDIFEKKDSAAG